MDPACFAPATYTLCLLRVGERRLEVMKALRTFRPDLSLAEAKRLVDSAPSTIGEGIRGVDLHQVTGIFLHTGAVMRLTDEFYGRVSTFGPC